LHEVVHRKRPELQPIDLILHYGSSPVHKALCVMQFLALESITEMEHHPVPLIWLQMTSGCFQK
jgi:hypothetical protein